MSKIVDCWWYSSYTVGCIGIVKVADDFGNEKFYIDVASGQNEIIDANMIAQLGAPFKPDVIN